MNHPSNRKNLDSQLPLFSYKWSRNFQRYIGYRTMHRICTPRPINYNININSKEIRWIKAFIEVCYASVPLNFHVQSTKIVWFLTFSLCNERTPANKTVKEFCNLSNNFKWVIIRRTNVNETSCCYSQSIKYEF